MGAEQFIKAQVGLQTAHGTPVTPTVQVPGRGEYQDGREHHVAPYDAGTWTPTTIVALVGNGARVTLRGTAFFETIPVLLNSGLADVAPSGGGPYTHTYTVNPAAVGAPMPLTGLFGAVGENLGGTGPAVRIPDLYLERLTLSGNVNSKEVSFEAALFGTQVDDNSGAGYAFASVGLPGSLDAIKALLGTVNIQDAAATGGDFLTMTAFSGAFLDWQWVLDTGARPKWSADANALTFGGVRFEPPSVEFRPTIRTSSTNYALVKAKHTARTYQELQLVLAGTSGRSLTINMTGRFTECPSAMERDQNEVVMKPTWRCETPHTQTTTPHWLTVINISQHNWT